MMNPLVAAKQIPVKREAGSSSKKELTNLYAKTNIFESS